MAGRQGPVWARQAVTHWRTTLIYQRATGDADQKIADKLSELVDQHRKGEVTATEEASEAE